MTTNFTGGVSNVSYQHVAGKMSIPSRMIEHSYFEDFDNYIASTWTVTETNASATQALTDADNGVLLITNTASDNDLVGMQKVGESFTFAVGKKLSFSARFKVSNATQCDAVMGLQITDTTPLSVSDGVYFIKNDDVATLDFVVVGSSTATTVSSIATLADDTYITVGFFYDGASSIHYYAGTDASNPTYLGKVATTNMPSTELTISLALQNGDANARTMSIDYISCSKDR